jgi:hypothetical protein
VGTSILLAPGSGESKAAGQQYYVARALDEIQRRFFAPGRDSGLPRDAAELRHKQPVS